RAAKGHSLTAHLEAATMAEACRLIAFTRMPVAQIGYRLGFGDPSYFSRRFRRRMGESPSDYRLRLQDG
ncbi:helix-turn-helix domain-containing protein, partial [Paracoccus aestuarii]